MNIRYVLSSVSPNVTIDDKKWSGLTPSNLIIFISRKKKLTKLTSRIRKFKRNSIAFLNQF